jgi:uncharacterized protein
MPAHLFPVLFAVAAFSGWIDAVAGSGGLLQLPVLLMLGGSVPVATLLGTNKLPASISKTFGATVYARRYPVDRVLALQSGLAATAGSSGGALFALSVSTAFLRPMIFAVLVVVAVFVLARPHFGTTSGRALPTGQDNEPSISRRRTLVLALSGAAAIGFYDGVVGPGTGIFLIMLFSTLLGREFVQVLSTVTWINFGTNIGALIVFAAHGDVLWALGLGMALFSIGGTIVGARMTLSRGSRFVRLIVLLVVSCTALRLAADQFGPELFGSHW